MLLFLHTVLVFLFFFFKFPKQLSQLILWLLSHLKMAFLCVICYSFPGRIVVKNLPANAGDARDASLIPELGGSPGGENGNPLQYSCLENSKERVAWQAIIHGVAKSRTRLSTTRHLLGGMKSTLKFEIQVF